MTTTVDTAARKAVQVKTACQLYDVSREVIIGAIRSNDLPAKKVGSRWLICLDDLATWYQNLPNA